MHWDKAHTITYGKDRIILRIYWVVCANRIVIRWHKDANKTWKLTVILLRFGSWLHTILTNEQGCFFRLFKNHMCIHLLLFFSWIKLFIYIKATKTSLCAKIIRKYINHKTEPCNSLLFVVKLNSPIYNLHLKKLTFK